MGFANFLDESYQGHVTAGGSVRAYFSRRGAIEPEVTYMYGSARDKDVLLQMNVSRDLGKATGRAVPFLIVGAGRLWHFDPLFTISTWTGGFGGGARVFVTERFFIAPEARLGTEPIVRFQVGLGWANRR